jgi:hypothetical protein
MPSSVIPNLDGRMTSVRQWEIKQLEAEVDFSQLDSMFAQLEIAKLRALIIPEQAAVEGSGGTSSRNVASTFGDLFAESLISVKSEIDSQINRFMIPQLVEQNFGTNAAKAEIRTVGFEDSDLELSREIVRLVGQRDLLSAVDVGRLLDRLGVPVLTGEALARRQAEVAARPPVSEGAPFASFADDPDGIDGQLSLRLPSPQVHVAAPVVNVPPAEVTVNVPPAQVDVTVESPPPSTRFVELHRDRDGQLESATVTDGEEEGED